MIRVQRLEIRSFTLASEHRPYLRTVGWHPDRLPTSLDFPFGLPAVKTLHNIEFHPDVTFLVGENGSGKSTLLEAIAIAWGFNAEGGTRNFRFSTAQAHTQLHEHLRLVRSVHKPRDGFFLRAESFFNLAPRRSAIAALPRPVPVPAPLAAELSANLQGVPKYNAPHASRRPAGPPGQAGCNSGPYGEKRHSGVPNRPGKGAVR